MINDRYGSIDKDIYFSVRDVNRTFRNLKSFVFDTSIQKTINIMKIPLWMCNSYNGFSSCIDYNGLVTVLLHLYRNSYILSSRQKIAENMLVWAHDICREYNRRTKVKIE